MNEQDTSRIRKQTIAPPTTSAFEDALIGVQIECGQLLNALRLCECEDAETAAVYAVASYLVAKVALRRLEMCSTEAAEDLRSANLALADARKALEQLFERASEQIDETSLHWLLRQLSFTIALANGEPLPKDPVDGSPR